MVKPIEYIVDLLNEKKEGSLYFELVKKGYIIDLTAGPMDV
jgi:secreted Zn-dependent insulinase-like peptidase